MSTGTFCRLGGGASRGRPRDILSTGIVDWDWAVLGFVDWDSPLHTHSQTGNTKGLEGFLLGAGAFACVFLLGTVSPVPPSPPDSSARDYVHSFGELGWGEKANVRYQHGPV